MFFIIIIIISIAKNYSKRLFITIFTFFIGIRNNIILIQIKTSSVLYWHKKSNVQHVFIIYIYYVYTYIYIKREQKKNCNPDNIVRCAYKPRYCCDVDFQKHNKKNYLLHYVNITIKHYRDNKKY